MSSEKPRDIEGVRALVTEILLELGVPGERIVDTATIDEDLGLESVAFVELQVALEDELCIEIDPVRVVELNELSAVVSYLHELSCRNQ